MRATFPLLVNTDFPVLKRQRPDTLQVNLGYTCNQSCVHCHVNAGPNRTEHPRYAYTFAFHRPSVERIGEPHRMPWIETHKPPREQRAVEAGRSV